jgi:hypothetical protein
MQRDSSSLRSVLRTICDMLSSPSSDYIEVQPFMSTQATQCYALSEPCPKRSWINVKINKASPNTTEAAEASPKR